MGRYFLVYKFEVLKLKRSKKITYIFSNKDQSPEIRKKEIIESLERYFGPQAGEYLDYTEKNWADEEYLGGK